MEQNVLLDEVLVTFNLSNIELVIQLLIIIIIFRYTATPSVFHQTCERFESAISVKQFISS
jgi:hypothetical protein